MHKHLKNLPGFTVVEVLVVIVIVGILAGLVYFGYGSYVKNTENAQIASVVSSYQNATNSASQERQIVPDNYPDNFGRLLSCISTSDVNAMCCVLYFVDASNNPSFGCANNAYFETFNARFGSAPAGTGFPVGYTASQLSTWVRQYLPASSLPKIPVNSTLTSCAATYTLRGTPCRSDHIGLQIEILPDGSTQYYLHYVLPYDRDCQSKEVATFGPTPAGFSNTVNGDTYYNAVPYTYTNAKYTHRYSLGATQYTFCVVGIK